MNNPVPGHADKLLAIAKELQTFLMEHNGNYPPMQAQILRMALDYLKEGWAMQRHREQELARRLKRELEQLLADEAERAAREQAQSTFGHKGAPE